MNILETAHADSLMPIVAYSFPPQRGVIIRDGKVVYQNPEFASVRSQDLEPIYHDCGQFYLCRTEAFLRYQTVITPNTVPMVMKEEEVQDIDHPSDWKIAEMKYRAFILEEGNWNV